MQGGLRSLAFSVRPGFTIPDKSLSIIDLAYRLVLEINRAVGELPRNHRPGPGRQSEASAFDLLEALVAGRYRRGPEKQAPLTINDLHKEAQAP
jgi:hypothetical protein